MTTLDFTVHGTPVPQGSKRIGRLGGKAGGRPIILDANDKTLGPWRNLMRDSAAEARHELGWGPFTGPVAIDLTFTVERPTSHFRGDGTLTRSARVAPSIRPDLDKYVRAALDAITESGAWEDDGQVVAIAASKVYGRRPGVHVKIAAVIAVDPAPVPCRTTWLVSATGQHPGVYVTCQREQDHPGYHVSGSWTYAESLEG